jgi:hypothetical protein
MYKTLIQRCNYTQTKVVIILKRNKNAKISFYFAIPIKGIPLFNENRINRRDFI